VSEIKPNILARCPMILRYKRPTFTAKTSAWETYYQLMGATARNKSIYVFVSAPAVLHGVPIHAAASKASRSSNMM